MAKEVVGARGAGCGIRGALILLAALAGLTAGPARAADPTPLDPECAVPESWLEFADEADGVVEALRAGKGVEIVAIGSSSTEGAGATAPELSYPSRLRAELAKRFPDQNITVVNRGVGGQLARQMLDRLKRDVIDERPDLVIWQTGTNDALALIDPKEFADTLEAGIDRLTEAGIDVMLMDLQFYPTVRHPEVYERYVAAMKRIAATEDIALFPRFAFMRYWAQHPPKSGASLWAGDRFHLGNLGYKCVAAVLAEAIEREVYGTRAAATAPLPPLPGDLALIMSRYE